MNTYACFIFLLAVGLSAQKSEFEIDFQSMVDTVKMNDRTLLNCTEKCDEVKEAECKCRRLTCSVETPFHKCIENGLDHLNLTNTTNIILRLKKLNITSEEKRIFTDQKLGRKMSPKIFLDYILELYQKSNVPKSNAQTSNAQTSNAQTSG